MNLISQLAIAIASGLVAAYLLISLPLSAFPAVAAVVVAATCVLPLVELFRRGASGTARTARSASGERNNDGDFEEGEVKWFNVSKGFGFIRRENGEEIFVHFRSIVGSKQGRRGLRDGQPVRFRVAETDKGPQAEDVESAD